MDKQVLLAKLYFVLCLLTTTTLAFQSHFYTCGVDVCNEEKYCDATTRRCEWCVNKQHDCFTEKHIANCTKFCRELPCKPPDGITHGSHNGSSYNYGTVVQYTCDLGYSMVGSNVTTCGELQQWSNPPPLCQANECPLPKPIRNGWIYVPDDVVKYLPGVNISYRCNDGYTLHSDANLTCLLESAWDKAVPSCQELPCKPPDGITNGSHNGSSYNYGTVVQYTCDLGYSIFGSDVTTCGELQQWSHSPPICQANPCLLPKILQNGGIVPLDVVSYTPGDTITYYCNDGFTLRGPAKLTCLYGSTWDNNTPMCERKQQKGFGNWKIATIALSVAVGTISTILFITCIWKNCKRKRKKANAIKPECNNNNGDIEMQTNNNTAKMNRIKRNATDTHACVNIEQENTQTAAALPPRDMHNNSSNDNTQDLNSQEQTNSRQSCNSLPSDASRQSMESAMTDIDKKHAAPIFNINLINNNTNNINTHGSDNKTKADDNDKYNLKEDVELKKPVQESKETAQSAENSVIEHEITESGGPVVKENCDFNNISHDSIDF